MGCPPEFIEQDRKLGAALHETATYRHEGDLLWLVDGRGVARVRLRQAR